MRDSLCRHCGSMDIHRKEIEIRQVNARTMTVRNSQMMTELECRVCGWVDTLSKTPVLVAL